MKAMAEKRQKFGGYTRPWLPLGAGGIAIRAKGGGCASSVALLLRLLGYGHRETPRATCRPLRRARHATDWQGKGIISGFTKSYFGGRCAQALSSIPLDCYIKLLGLDIVYHKRVCISKIVWSSLSPTLSLNLCIHGCG